MTPADSSELSKREVNKRANYEKLLYAAKVAFLDQGYEGATIRDIIRKSGLASGTFYNYFPDKESIFRAIVDEYLFNLSQELKKARQKADCLHAYIEPTFRIFFTHIAENSDLYRLGRRNESALSSFYNSSLMEIIWQELIVDIEDAVKNNIIPRIDPQLLAASFIGLGHELARLLINQSDRSPEEMAKFASKMFIGGLAYYQSEQSGSHKTHPVSH